MGTAEVKILRPEQLWPNEGQIPGIPTNPRIIKDDKFHKLVKSIKQDPEMLNLRELLVYQHKGKYVIIGGNMRFRACVEAGINQIPCKIIPQSTPIEKIKAYLMKDNIGYGETNWDDIANDWDLEELQDWGMDLPKFLLEEDEEEEDEGEKTYTPTYKFEVQCKTENDKNKLMAELLDRGITCTDDY